MPSRARWRSRVARVGPLLALLALPPLGHAADPKPASPDDDFLEFLGNSDDADPELQQYLARPEAADTEDVKPAPKRGSGPT